jgi:hypothetical protein
MRPPMLNEILGKESMRLQSTYDPTGLGIRWQSCCLNQQTSKISLMYAHTEMLTDSDIKLASPD